LHVTIAVGVLVVKAVVLLAKGIQGAYKAALFALVPGVVAGMLPMVTSRSLRGESMPVAASVCITRLTPVIFLIFCISAIGNGVETTKAPHREGGKSGGATAFLQPGTGDDDPFTAASADDPRMLLQLSKKS